MRAILISAVILVAALAGCSSKKGDDEHLHYTCPDGTEIHADDYEGVLENITVDFLKTKCPKGSGTSSTTNTTSQAPNVLPNLVLNVTNFEGTATNVTLVDGNLTFSAAGSTDPDGQVTAIAISVKDSNRTQTKSLYDFATKTFTPATFTFDRPGVVNVSVAMVDDRAGFASIATFAYVNEVKVTAGKSISVPAADLAGTSPLHHVCRGASNSPAGSSGPIIDQPYFQTEAVSVLAGTTFIEVTSTEDVAMTICNPAGEAVSEELQEGSVVSNQPLPLPADPTSGYTVAFYGTSPGASTAATITIHYEPAPAAAA